MTDPIEKDTTKDSSEDPTSDQEKDQDPIRQKVPAQVNGINRVTVGRPGVIVDIIFIISEGAAIPIPPEVKKRKHETVTGQNQIAKAYLQAVEEAQDLSSKAETLVSAKSALVPQGSTENVASAQDDMRKTLAKYSSGEDEDTHDTAETQQEASTTPATTEDSGDNNAPTKPPLTSEKQDFVEVYSFAEEKLLLLPAKTIKTARSRVESDDNVYYIDTETTTENSRGSETKSTVTRTKKQPINLKDALKGLRASPASNNEGSNSGDSSEGSSSDTSAEETGELDSEKVKQAWGPVKKQIAMDWKLGQVRKEGQIPARLAAYALSPTVANFFDEDDYAAVDAFVKKINDAATKRWRQYDDRRKTLVETLEKCIKDKPATGLFSSTSKIVDLSPEEWDKIIREVKDIWWDGWEHLENGIGVAKATNKYQEFAQSFSETVKPSTETMLKQAASSLAKAPLPPVMWDASVGAQILRYSAGATAKANFDLLETGKLGLEASADVKFNLLEAKADGSFYLPDSEGANLEFELPIRKKEGHWAELVDKLTGKSKRFLPAEPTFAFDKSLLSPKGIFSLGEGLQTWKITAESVQQPDLEQGDVQLKIQIAGHTDAVGSAGYNQSLSERRAQAGLGFLANRPAIWLNFFKSGQWGDDEVRLMAATTLCLDHWQLDLDWKNIDSEDALLAQIRTRLANLEENENDNTSNISIEQRFDMPQNLGNALQRARLEEAEELIDKGSTAALIKMFQQGGNVELPSPIRLIPGDWSPKHPSGIATLRSVIGAYFNVSRTAVENELPPGAVFFDKVSFHSEETKGLGESSLKIASNTREERNRRLELIPYGLTSQREKMEHGTYNFGEVRMQLSGKISGEAGVNLNLGAKVDFEVNKDLLMVGGLVGGALGQDVTATGGASKTIDPANTVSYEKETTKAAPSEGSKARSLADFNAGAEAKGGAFIGAKAEAGIKAAIEWRPPEKSAEEVKAEASLPASKTIRDFLLLGDVGYSVTGMAGAGLEGEFKIGFDRESKRFQIKVKAQASLGLGCGGAFSFSVAIKHIFDFVKLVHEKLSDNDFHFIDVFESTSDGSEIDVYKLFSAWSFEMLQRGQILEAGLAYVAGGALEAANELLSKADNIIDDWDEEEIEAENLDTLLETIHKNPPQLALCTPETKGRLLYRLLQAKVVRQGDGFFDQRWNQLKRWGLEPGRRIQEIINLDRYHTVEKAALLVVTKGVISPRDWQKTLQNMAAIDSQGQMVPVGSALEGDSLDAKITRSLENQTELRTVLLEDEDDQKALDKHLKSIGVEF